MLKLVHNTSRRQPDAHIEVPPEMGEDDRTRLASLAIVFYGHAVPSRDTYIFTEARGTKCWLLFKHGFEALKVRHNKYDRQCITHPRDRRKYHISEAVSCARMMEPELVAIEEAKTAPGENWG